MNSDFSQFLHKRTNQRANTDIHNNLIFKEKNRIIPTFNIKQKKFENHFNIFKNVKTYVNINDYFQQIQLGDGKKQAIQKSLSRIRLSQLFLNPKMHLLLGSMDAQKETLENLQVLEKAQSLLQGKKMKQESNSLWDTIITKLEAEMDLKDDKFYQSIQEANLSRGVALKNSELNEFRKIMKNAGISSKAQQDQHIEKLSSSKVQLDFEKETEKLLLMLKKETKKIYQKNIIEQVKEDEQQLRELREIREKIMNNKIRRRKKKNQTEQSEKSIEIQKSKSQIKSHQQVQHKKQQDSVKSPTSIIISSPKLESPQVVKRYLNQEMKNFDLLTEKIDNTYQSIQNERSQYEQEFKGIQNIQRRLTESVKPYEMESLKFLEKSYLFSQKKLKPINQKQIHKQDVL